MLALILAEAEGPAGDGEKRSLRSADSPDRYVIDAFACAGHEPLVVNLRRAVYCKLVPGTAHRALYGHREWVCGGSR